MPNPYFQFKEFRINQQSSGMKVTTDGCLFGAWVASELKKTHPEPLRILDIGTGTGLLSLIVAQATLHTHMVAIELDHETLREARQNFQNSPWNNRLIAENVSIQDFQSDERFEVIICNPPFFTNNRKGHNTIKNRAIHTDTLSMEELLQSALKWLSKDGHIYLLYPAYEMNVFCQLAETKGLFLQHKALVRNGPNLPVFRVMARFSTKRGQAQQTEILIKNRGTYSKGFMNLLKDYYL